MTLGEFFAMGGYGFYVWSAYGITLLLLIVNVVVPIRQRKQFFRQQLFKSKRL